MVGILKDRGGRRSVADRRRSFSGNLFPERRSYKIRRSDSDRRRPRIFGVPPIFGIIRKDTERRQASRYI